MSLRDDAKAAARPTVVPHGENRTVGDRPVEDAEPTWEDPNDSGIVHNEESWEALPTIDYTNSGIPTTPTDAPLIQAWQAVMAEVTEVRKDGKFSGGGANYSYRGVDAVVNAVGPALRKHRVVILPIDMQPSYRDVEVGGKRTPMRECTMIVTYKIIGANSDEWIVQGAGESLDSGDKGTTKAGTVAYRNMLLTALSIPVNNPRLDADAMEYRRAESRPTNLPDAGELKNEILTGQMSYQRMNQIYMDINPRNPDAKFPALGAVIVVNEQGNEEKLAALYWRLRNDHPDNPKNHVGAASE